MRSVLSLCLLAGVVGVGGAPAFGDVLPVAADAHVSEATPTTRYGSFPTVMVQNGGAGGESRGLVRFDLKTLPAGRPVGRALLRMWVAQLSSAGTLELHVALEPWQEASVTATSAPAFGPAVQTLGLTRSSQGHYVTFEVTAPVADWASGAVANNGFVLVAAPGGQLVSAFDSKENTGTSHAMELEVTTADALGSLTCTTAGDVPKWSDSGWTCGPDLDTNSGGTVTAVTAGSGLSGGTVTSSGTLAVDYAAVQTRVGGFCPPGSGIRVVNSNGTVVCQLDTNSGGTVTAVSAGAGLTGGPITTSGTLNVNFAGTGSAASAARSDHNHDATYQARITGSCGPGSYVRGVNPDGTLRCQADAGITQPGSTISVAEDQVNAGFWSSATIGNDGLGLISYYDMFFGELHVAHCNDVNCTASTVTLLDAGTGIRPGRYTSITIGNDGLGLISYYEPSNGDLKVAHCSNTACTAATLSVLDTAGDVGQFTSITIGSDGLGLISYYDVTNQNLKVAHCANAACSSASLVTVDATGDVGSHTSVALGADNLPLISYRDQTNVGLKVAHCSNLFCTAATLTALDTGSVNVGFFTSVAIGADGLGLIAYWDAANGHPKTAHCLNAACSLATFATIDAGTNMGYDDSVAIGADGLGVVAYIDGTARSLKVAHCSNVSCSLATLSVVDVGGDVGRFNSVTIGTDGLPLISYYDAVNGDLKVTHCGNALCSPFVVRRR
jgi:hypothetical protein